MNSYTRSAAVYDLLYQWKDYAAEVERLHGLITRYQRSEGNTLLDVACGTGKHLEHFARHFTVEGVELDAEMLKVARQRLPTVPLHQGDMRTFDLGKQFDVVTCLFSAIGHMVTPAELTQALTTMARHVREGGLLIVEGWLTPDDWKDGHVASLYAKQDDLHVARMNISRREGTISYLDFHYLIGTPQGIHRFDESLAMALYTPAEYRAALLQSGVTRIIDEPMVLSTRPLVMGGK